MENYYDQIRNDVLQALRDYTADDFEGMDHDAIAEKLEDDLWTDDAVTGNGSGSYFFNAAAAQEMVLNNYDYVAEIADVYGHETIGAQLIDGDWESIDVSIRCYLLPDMIADILDGIDFDDEDAVVELIQRGA